MAHNISGIITSFKYEGNLPNIVLVENYHLIPLESGHRQTSSEKIIEPHEESTPDIEATIKDLSFYGRCAYIETAYFGGIGAQVSETWENGQIIEGPLVSYDGIENKVQSTHRTIVDYAINQALKNIGVTCEEGHDEFDTVGLGRYRSNRRILEEYHQKK